MAESKSDFTPQNPGFANRVQSSFAQQSVMKLIGAELVKVVLESPRVKNFETLCDK